MKKSFKGLGSRISLLFTGAMAAVGLKPKSKSFNAPEANPIKRSNKSSGGSAKGGFSKSLEAAAWHRLFGGLAVPRPGFLDLDTPPLKFHKANIRGPRPYSFYKLSRA